MTGPGLGSDARDSAAVSLLVPVADVDGPLAPFVTEVSNALTAGGHTHEVIFVVRSSDENSLKEIGSMGGTGAHVRVVLVGERDPEAMVPEVAAEEARSPLIATLPAYPRIAAEGVCALVDAIDDSVDLVTAARDPHGAPFGSRVRRSAFHLMLRWLVGGSFRDIASGVRVMRRDVLVETRLFGDAYRFLPLFAQRDGFRVREILLPVHARHTKTRFHGSGVYARRLVDLLGLMFLIRFTYMPLRFFGVLGGGTAGLGALILLVLLVQRLGGQGIADRPLLLLGVMLVVLGMQALALGLVGEIVVHHGLTNHASYRVLGDRDAASS